MKFKAVQETMESLHFSKIFRGDFNVFKEALLDFRKSIQGSKESEENHKNKLIAFLQKVHSDKYINTKDKIDLVISQKEKSNPYVLFETKKLSEKHDMLSKDDLNKKSLQQLILYYLNERVSQENTQLKRLVVTNFEEWYIFDNNDFEKIVYGDKALLKDYQSFKNEKKDNPFFYDEVARKWIETNIDKFAKKIIYFSLSEFFTEDGNLQDNEQKLIALYRVFSKHYLLKEPYKSYNDLDMGFYREILYLMGLEEVSENSNLYIRRCKEKKRQTGSLLENTLHCMKTYKKAEFNQLSEDEKFELAFELCIIWINRILFLKLLESQLIAYHKEQKKDVSFLNYRVINEFRTLDTIFFEILPEKDAEERKKLGFEYLPYLNSSLFEISELEKGWICINGLKRHTLKKMPQSVIEDKKEEFDFLQYLFGFLDSYSFSAEKFSEIQEDSKTLINSSVLGLLFEKINGYKAGSHFTPSEVTMFMARESLHQTILGRMQAEHKLHFKDFQQLVSNQQARQKVQEVVESIKICDPSVGSGHFLVSVLNELIYIKYQLGIIQNKNQHFRDFKIEIKNDEIIIYDTFKGKYFEYHLNPKGEIIESLQAVQKTLFEEKRQIIESSLFGVDINKKSVYICRLRLWIELLKNTYYLENTNSTQLHTLPNIDINIKEGDSLLSLLPIDLDLQKVLELEDFQSYQRFVNEYKNITDKLDKSDIEQSIQNIKSKLLEQAKEQNRKEILDKIEAKIRQKEQIASQTNLMAIIENKAQKKKLEKEKKQLEAEIVLAKRKHQERLDFFAKQAKSFEWRLEFPEVTNSETFHFQGFDLVIGNPPYIQLQKDKGYLGKLYEEEDFQTFAKTGDIYALFYEKAKTLARAKGFVCFITSNKWMRAGYGENLRQFFTQQTNPTTLIDLGADIFDSATVDTNILIYQNQNPQHQAIQAYILKQSLKNSKDSNPLYTLFQTGKTQIQAFQNSQSWTILKPEEHSIKQKIEQIGTPLKDWDISINYGIKTGYNEAFIIDTQKRDEILEQCKDEAERSKTEKLIKPILRGKDIKKYQANWANLFLIFIPWHFPLHENDDIEGASKEAEREFELQYNTLYQHFLRYKDKLSQRNKAETGIRYEWYALQRCANTYYPEFEKEKIVWGNINYSSQFSYIDKTMLISAPSNILTTASISSKYLISQMNSNIFNWYFSQLSGITLGSAFEWKKQYVEEIPIPKLSKQEQKPFIALVEQILHNKEKGIDTQSLETQINQMVYKLYQLTPEEIALIET